MPMPTKDEHLYKANGNAKFADAIIPVGPIIIGWALTVLFYSALHYIEAYNAKFNKHFTSHHDRNDDLRNHPVLDPIYDDYMDLKNYSSNARYGTQRYGKTELQEAKDSLIVIREFISKLL
jgi:hypothetical protein